MCPNICPAKTYLENNVKKRLSDILSEIADDKIVVSWKLIQDLLK